jgi:hypothetical protein
MDKEFIHQMLSDIKGRADAIGAELQDKVTVRAGENLATALEKGGIIELEAGASFEAQGFLLKEGTVINGNNAHLHGQRLSAITVPHSSTLYGIHDLKLTSENDQAVLLLGENTQNQNTLEKVPSDIVLSNLKFPSYRGKNCIENNAREVLIDTCEVTDHYHHAGAESHGIVTLNTPGGLKIIGGYYHGSSIPFLFGGDEMDIDLPIPIERIENITIEDVKTEVPFEWQRTGKKIKTRLEFKNAHGVRVKNFTGIYSYADGQAGYGELITPTRDGSCSTITHDGLYLYNIGGGILSTGIDKRDKTTQILVKNFHFRIDTKFGGTEWAFHLQRDYGTFDVEDGIIESNGSALLRLDTPTLERFSMRRVKAPVGRYGIQVLGVHTNLALRKDNLNIIIEENEFSGANEVFKENWPNNSWV